MTETIIVSPLTNNFSSLVADIRSTVVVELYDNFVDTYDTSNILWASLPYNYTTYKYDSLFKEMCKILPRVIFTPSRIISLSNGITDTIVVSYVSNKLFETIINNINKTFNVECEYNLRYPSIYLSTVPKGQGKDLSTKLTSMYVRYFQRKDYLLPVSSLAMVDPMNTIQYNIGFKPIKINMEKPNAI